MRWIAFLSLLIPVLFGALSGAQACSCTEKLPPQAQMDASSAVFTGKVTNKKWFEKELRRGNRVVAVKQIVLVTFQPTRMWKGDPLPSIEVEVPDPDEDDCGIDFKRGEEYLVYATSKQRLETDICMRSKLASQAAEDLQSLGPPR